MSRKPPNQDQQNNGRNEYIPAYISKAPFYAEGLSDGDYLEHQRLHATPKDTLDKAKWYDRGRKSGPAATKFRKGACENCGAMTHKTKDCLSRPRKHGAKWTGQDIQADEVVDEVRLGWDAKRDRWNGYDAREYSAVVKEYEEMEELRKMAQQTDTTKLLTSNGEGGDDDDDDDRANATTEDKYAEETDMGRSQPTSTRQLRLREDTAKYLVNLDLNSARYDPKTRSMDTTAQDLSSSNKVDSIAEEGFVRPSGTADDAAAFERAQRYAWETQESGNVPTSTNKSTTGDTALERKLHLQANPTEGEFLMKKRDAEAQAKKAAQQKFLQDRYGVMDSPTSSLARPSAATALSDRLGSNQAKKLISSSTSYVEYDKHGNPKDGPAKTVARSKYPEDIHPNNHTSVFGSWWSNFVWGYACCHSTVRNSYCTGEEGKAAFEQAESMRTGRDLVAVNTINEPKVQAVHGRELDTKPDQNLESVETEITSKENNSSNKKRRFAQTDSHSSTSLISDAEMEAYKRSKLSASDPMHNLDTSRLGADGLLQQQS